MHLTSVYGLCTRVNVLFTIGLYKGVVFCYYLASLTDWKNSFANGFLTVLKLASINRVGTYMSLGCYSVHAELVNHES